VKCSKLYTNIPYKWCKSCQLNYLKGNFINRTSKSEKIDNFIQKMQLKINETSDIVFEWIPYNQFNKIKRINKYNFDAVYSAKWKDGPLYWNKVNGEYRRDPDKTVVLKCLYNSQNIIDYSLNTKV